MLIIYKDKIVKGVKNLEIVIEVAKSVDASRILEIYTPYVLNTAITFEYKVPGIEEFKNRIKNTLVKYPYLVAKLNNKIVGYAYTSAFKNREAYNWSVETTVYVDTDYQHMGIGKSLYLELEKISKAQNILNLNACIAIPDKGSVAFHKHMGYQQVAYFHSCGYKLNSWYDMIWMEKMLGEHLIEPKDYIPFSNLDYCFD